MSTDGHSHIHTAVVDLTIISIGYDNIALPEVVAEIWEHGEITSAKSSRARKRRIQTIRGGKLESERT